MPRRPGRDARGATSVLRPSGARLLDRADAELPALPATPERNLVLSDVRDMQGMLELDAGRRAAALTLFEEARSLRRASTDADTSDIDYIVASVGVFDGHGSRRDSRRCCRSPAALATARLESTGVTAFRWTAAVAVRVMDYPAAAVGLR